MAWNHHHRVPRGVAASGSLRRQREGGYVLTIFGLLLVPLLLMAGLAVDVGYWYNRASDIQKAADAASLAGVVWLPDANKARQVALDVAERNGFKHGDPGITVTATPSTKAPRRLKVTIRDTRVSSFFYKNLGGSNIGLTRTSFAEYVTPVPMGSPRNFFGLGTLDGTGFSKEYLYQSVNPYCTSKANGDRHQNPFNTGPTGSHNVSSSACLATPTDPDYRSTGYELYIDAPPNRPAPIEILLYDARYNAQDTVNYTEPGNPSCTITGYTYTYPTQTTSGWTGPVTNNTSNLTINGPRQYQTRNAQGVWSAVSQLSETQSTTFRRDRLRYRSPTTTTPIETCVPTTVNRTEAVVDSTLNNNSNTETYTYSVYASDNTPLDDTDNPLVCERTFNKTDPFDSTVYLGSRRWNAMTVSRTNLTPCTIPTTAVNGRYILRVRNNGARGNDADGSNQWGVVARYTSAASPGLCDGRTNALCPRVYGKDAISVRAAADTQEASFFLAEIPAEHVGKKLKIDLWDPGEGGSEIRILRPTASANPDGAWTEVAFDWKATGVTGSGTNVTSVGVTGSKFNARLLEITVDLAGYSPPTNNNWWKIYYKFDDPDLDVTDRTTWSARILGDPVHLVEEN